MEKKILPGLLVYFLALLTISCSNEKDPAPDKDDNLVETSLIGSQSAAELRLLIQFSGRDIDPALLRYDVDIYKVVYKTTYKDSEINASGLVLLPKTNESVGMISFHHGTIVQQSDAPSVQSQSSEEVISFAALASTGLITVVPDMIGFGESKEIFHPYYVEAPTASAVVDNLLAARSLAGEKEVTFNSKLFLAGYSEGGYITMAAHKAIETTPIENFQLIASFPAAGGYDIKSMQAYLFEQPSYPQPYYLAYVAKSYQAYYAKPDLLSDFFRDPYATSIPNLFNGQKSPDEINAALTTEIPALVTEGILANIETGSQYAYIREALEENSLVGWTPTLPMYMYHGDADTTVPYENSEQTYEKLLSNGADPEKLQLITLTGADHSSGILPYIENLVEKLEALK